MSDIQRWHLQGLPGTTGIVDVMSYADHLAALAAERNKDLAQWLGEAGEREYERGVSAERARIRTAVDEMFLRLPFTEFQVGYCTGLRDVKTKVIDGEEA